MKRNNAILVTIFVVVVAITFITIAFWEERSRDIQVSAFKQFVSDHNYTLKVGTISDFTNITTLDLTSFEQKCTIILSGQSYGSPREIIDEQTNTWLIFPQDTFIVIDWSTRTVYQWII